MRRQQLLFSFGLGLLCVIALSGLWLSPFNLSPRAKLFEPSSAFAQSPPNNSALVPRSHALPESLAAWQPKQDSSDYFAAISRLPLGYLIWSDRPISVSIGPSHFNDPYRQQDWERHVNAAIREWQAYFPIQVTSGQAADIIIKQERTRRTNQGARSAQATPEPYCKGDRIQHRFLIQVNPSQAGRFIQSATRHELGHALGIWGHSPNPQDVLYERQVANPPPISERDINTLKKIYQQTTLLGWPAPQYCPTASS